MAVTTTPDPRPARAAVFIDMDGTLVHDVQDDVDPRRLRFMAHAPATLSALQAAGFALVVVTHQSGLARGLFTRAQFAALHAALEQRLADQSGAVLTDFVLCPHAPDGHGRRACLCRRPSPGLLLRAALRHRIDLSRSWMVGDTLDDVEAGQRAGCRSILFDSGGETVWRRSPLRTPHARCTDWRGVAAFILAPSAQATTAPQHAVSLRA